MKSTLTRIVYFLPTMSSPTISMIRMLPQACSRSGSPQSRTLVLKSSSKLRPAEACCPRRQLEFRHYLPVPVSRAAHRSYASGRPQPPGGTYRMNLGNGGGEEKSALEQYGVDLTSKAREGKLDPVIGRDSVRRFSIATVGSLRHILLYFSINMFHGSVY